MRAVMVDNSGTGAGESSSDSGAGAPGAATTTRWKVAGSRLGVALEENSMKSAVWRISLAEDRDSAARDSDGAAATSVAMTWSISSREAARISSSCSQKSGAVSP